MTIKKYIIRFIIALLLCITQVAGIDMYAQNFQIESTRTDSLILIDADSQGRLEGIPVPPTDSLTIDSLARLNEESMITLESPVDTAQIVITDSTTIEAPRQFIPNSTRAIWLASVFPGGGQIYNRKYWKLPIIYGGFVGCSYALAWNNKTYKDYSQAYLDIMDNDPNTNSHLDIPGITPGNDERNKELLRNRKDYFRRYRDLSIFAFIGVYLISIIDAYVDAELSDFDISRDLGLKIEPAIINDRRTGNSFGLQCSIKF